MAVAVVAGVWSGAYATLGKDARRHASFTWWVVNRLLFLAAATSFQGFLPFFLMYAFGVGAEAGVRVRHPALHPAVGSDAGRDRLPSPLPVPAAAGAGEPLISPPRRS